MLHRRALLHHHRSDLESRISNPESQTSCQSHDKERVHASQIALMRQKCWDFYDFAFPVAVCRDFVVNLQHMIRDPCDLAARQVDRRFSLPRRGYAARGTSWRFGASSTGTEDGKGRRAGAQTFRCHDCNKQCRAPLGHESPARKRRVR